MALSTSARRFSCNEHCVRRLQLSLAKHSARLHIACKPTAGNPAALPASKLRSGRTHRRRAAGVDTKQHAPDENSQQRAPHGAQVVHGVAQRLRGVSCCAVDALERNRALNARAGVELAAAAGCEVTRVEQDTCTNCACDRKCAPRGVLSSKQRLARTPQAADVALCVPSTSTRRRVCAVGMPLRVLRSTPDRPCGHDAAPQRTDPGRRAHSRSTPTSSSVARQSARGPCLGRRACSARGRCRRIACCGCAGAGAGCRSQATQPTRGSIGSAPLCIRVSNRCVNPSCELCARPRRATTRRRYSPVTRAALRRPWPCSSRRSAAACAPTAALRRRAPAAGGTACESRA